MLLTITTTHQPASELSFLVHKHPGKVQVFDQSFGRAVVYYPEVSGERCTAALLLDIDPISLVRGRSSMQASGPLDQYVNDRPYVASSFLSVAISRVFRSAMLGKCRERPELARQPIPLKAEIDVLPSRGGPELLNRLFTPLGYRLTATRHPLDEQFPEWGDSPYYSVTLERECRLSELLTHLYVLVPVLDNHKHYWVGDAEVENLLSKGADWLGDHPDSELITKRYLKYQRSLTREALARLRDEPGGQADGEASYTAVGPNREEQQLEASLSLNDERLGTVVSVLKSSGATRVLDLGCGEGKLIQRLLGERQFTEIIGVDVSVGSLETAASRLKLDRMPEKQRQRIRLMHGSLMYRDRRFHGFDAASLVEVVEHLDPPRLAAFEQVVFAHARPGTVVVTTPNREYNVRWESVGPDRLRHRDHRFEWTREGLRGWAHGLAERHGYTVQFLSIGIEDAEVGSPTQLALFELNQ